MHYLSVGSGQLDPVTLQRIEAAAPPVAPAQRVAGAFATTRVSTQVGWQVLRQGASIFLRALRNPTVRGTFRSITDLEGPDFGPTLRIIQRLVKSLLLDSCGQRGTEALEYLMGPQHCLAQGATNLRLAVARASEAGGVNPLQTLAGTVYRLAHMEEGGARASGIEALRTHLVEMMFPQGATELPVFVTLRSVAHRALLGADSGNLGLRFFLDQMIRFNTELPTLADMEAEELDPAQEGGPRTAAVDLGRLLTALCVDLLSQKDVQVKIGVVILEEVWEASPDFKRTLLEEYGESLPAGFEFPSEAAALEKFESLKPWDPVILQTEKALGWIARLVLGDVFNRGYVNLSMGQSIKGFVEGKLSQALLFVLRNLRDHFVEHPEGIAPLIREVKYLVSNSD